MARQDTFGISSATTRDVGLDWHVWVFLAHFFRFCLRHAGQAARFCEKQHIGF